MSVLSLHNKSCGGGVLKIICTTLRKSFQLSNSSCNQRYMSHVTTQPKFKKSQLYRDKAMTETVQKKNWVGVRRWTMCLRYCGSGGQTGWQNRKSWCPMLSGLTGRKDTGCEDWVTMWHLDIM